MSLAERLIELRYSAATSEDWKKLAKDAALELERIKSDKSDIYATGPKVHGSFQHARLDVLDQREQRICGIHDDALAQYARLKGLGK